MRKSFSLTERSLEIKNLIVQLTTLLKNQNKGLNINITQSRKNLTLEEKKDSIRILAIKINSINAVDHDQFTSSTQFDVKKSEIYSRAMKGLHAAKQTRTIEKKLN